MSLEKRYKNEIAPYIPEAPTFNEEVNRNSAIGAFDNKFEFDQMGTGQTENMEYSPGYKNYQEYMLLNQRLTNN